MPDDYSSWIADEQNAISDLEKELQRRRRVLALLENAQHSLGSPAESPYSSDGQKASNEKKEARVKNSHEENTVPDRINKDSEALLRLIKTETLPANIIAARCKQAGYNIDRSEISSRLGRYKRAYGFVENPARGVYRLSEKGRQYMDTYYPDPK